jgi:hypothetical protein
MWRQNDQGGEIAYKFQDGSYEFQMSESLGYDHYVFHTMMDSGIWK